MFWGNSEKEVTSIFCGNHLKTCSFSLDVKHANQIVSVPGSTFPSQEKLVLGWDQHCDNFNENKETTSSKRSGIWAFWLYIWSSSFPFLLKPFDLDFLVLVIELILSHIQSLFLLVRSEWMTLVDTVFNWEPDFPGRWVSACFYTIYFYLDLSIIWFWYFNITLASLLNPVPSAVHYDLYFSAILT